MNKDISALFALTLLTGFFVAGPPAMAQSAAAPAAEVPLCAPLPEYEDAEEISGQAPYRFLQDVVAQNGPEYWQPVNGRERPFCQVEAFTARHSEGRQHITIFHAGFLKGIQTALYRIDVSGGQPRELYVLYSPSLDFMSGIHLAFTLVEASTDRLDLYAMYHSEPPYQQVRSLVEAIAIGEATPTLSAKWPKAGEAPVVTIDRVQQY